MIIYKVISILIFMKIKQIPEDFIVHEIYSPEKFKEKDERDEFFYFKLTKKDYTQIKAIEKIAKIFNVSKKTIHFAGTKDRKAITSQVISMHYVNEDTLKENLKFLNEKVEDLELEFLGKFKGRINLGDNLGNKFTITIRDLENSDIEKAKNNLRDIKRNGVLNYFDSQRFGYANNSHIIGKYILRNEINNAVFEILTSLPQNPNLENIEFAKFIDKSKQNIKEQNTEIIDSAIELAPKYLRDEVKILNHLKSAKNDFPGAFRTIHKKLRTLYINAYQSYIFNEILDKIKKGRIKTNREEINLINSETVYDEEFMKVICNILKRDGLTQENFKLPHMPELIRNQKQVSRKIVVHPKNLEISRVENDDLNEGKKKMIVMFELSRGEYATNITKQLFI